MITLGSERVNMRSLIGLSVLSNELYFPLKKQFPSLRVEIKQMEMEMPKNKSKQNEIALDTDITKFVIVKV